MDFGLQGDAHRAGAGISVVQGFEICAVDHGIGPERATPGTWPTGTYLPPTLKVPNLKAIEYILDSQTQNMAPKRQACK